MVGERQPLPHKADRTLYFLEVDQMHFIGIDPGATGAITVISANDCVNIFKMPDTTEGIAHLIGNLNPEVSRVLCELQQARPAYARKMNHETHQEEFTVLRGVNATWTFAQHYGELRMALVMRGFEPEYIRPVDWMRALGIPKREKGMSQTAWKGRLHDKAKELFPDLKIIKAAADSVLIAETCRRLYTQEQRRPRFNFDDI